MKAGRVAARTGFNFVPVEVSMAHESNEVTKDALAMIDKAARLCAKAKEEEISQVLYSLSCNLVRSPIEQYFMCAFLATSKANAFGVVLTPHQEASDPLGSVDTKTHREIVIVPQYPIECYRADFAISSWWSDAPLVVELDGHDWHERTEKQRRYEKRRDRRMQALGYRVARYTGSEVWRDPFAVAADALSLLTGEEHGFLGGVANLEADQP